MEQSQISAPGAAAAITLRLCAEAPPEAADRAALLFDGALLGTSPATVKAAPEGEYLFTALPLCIARTGYGCYGVTRALRFAAGRPEECPPDVDLYDWGSGVYEAVLHLPVLYPEAERRFPFTVARLPWELPAARERLLAVLYHDGGLWLAVENGAHVLCGHPLLGEAEGELYTTMRCLVAVTRDGAQQEALVLGPDRRIRLRLRADRIDVADGCITATDTLPTQRAHERRTRYRCRETEWTAEPAETGFFTHEPLPAASLPLALLEALLIGAADEALSYLSPALRDGLDAQALASFIGPFSGIRPFFLARPERPEFGVYEPGDAGAARCRRFAFALDRAGLIDDIAEQDDGGDGGRGEGA